MCMDRTKQIRRGGAIPEKAYLYFKVPYCGVNRPSPQCRFFWPLVVSLPAFLLLRFLASLTLSRLAVLMVSD